MQSGKVYGLQGINGSGKTMLMRAINGEVLGKDIEFFRSIGFLLENPSFLNCYSGYQNSHMLAYLKNKVTNKEIEEVLIKIGLDPKAIKSTL